MKIKTNGKCFQCNGEYKSSKAKVHLNKCLEKWNSLLQMKEGYLIRISCAEQPNLYWMFATIPKKCSLNLLDIFLRNTWLECCGHLSLFKIGNKQYYSHTESGNHSKFMNKQIDQMVSTGDKFDYIYDMGSSTYLKIQVLEVIPACPQKNVTLLIKNDQPNFLCESCQKEANSICSMCGDTVCSNCCDNHICVIEEGEAYMIMPLVNSPRVGVCGYEG